MIRVGSRRAMSWKLFLRLRFIKEQTGWQARHCPRPGPGKVFSHIISWVSTCPLITDTTPHTCHTWLSPGQTADTEHEHCHSSPHSRGSGHWSHYPNSFVWNIFLSEVLSGGLTSDNWEDNCSMSAPAPACHHHHHSMILHSATYKYFSSLWK